MGTAEVGERDAGWRNVFAIGLEVFVADGRSKPSNRDSGCSRKSYDVLSISCGQDVSTLTLTKQCCGR
jgi:hypothetical protein